MKRSPTPIRLWRRSQRWPNRFAAIDKPVTADNPFTALQENVSRQIVAALDAWRDATEAFSERTFMAVYNSPTLQAGVGVDARSTTPLRRAAKSELHRELIERRIAELKSHIPLGGPREAVIRALIFAGLGRAAVDERGFEMVRRIRQAFGDLSLPAFKSAVREQFSILVIDADAALAAIPSMLPDDIETRNKAFDIVSGVLGARGEYSTEDQRRIERVGRIVWRRCQIERPRKSRHCLRQSGRPSGQSIMRELGLPQTSGPAPGGQSKYDRLIAEAKKVPAAKTIVVHPCDETSLRGAIDAAEAGLIVPVLVGPAAKIQHVAHEHKIDIGKFELVDVPHSDAAAAKAVELIRGGQGEMLMKGSLHTDELMRAVTAASTGLRTARRISHVFIMDVPTHTETLFITDAAINIFPDLDVKHDIVQNAIDLFTAVGLGKPRVAILSAVETVTSKIPSTIDAAALCKMADRGQITGAVLDGPLAFDNAIDLEAARIKGIHSPVAGQAQILVVPDLEAGNMLAKNLIYLAKADSAGLVLGARVPIVLTSRADSVRSRMASCAVAVLYAAARRVKATVPAA